MLGALTHAGAETQKAPVGGPTGAGYCCIRLFERRWCLCDHGGLMVPPAASKSDCSRDDDGAGKMMMVQARRTRMD